MQIIDANFLATDYQLLICLVTNYPLLNVEITNGYSIAD
jgi:hypothetical protein